MPIVGVLLSQYDAPKLVKKVNSIHDKRYFRISVILKPGSVKDYLDTKMIPYCKAFFNGGFSQFSPPSLRHFAKIKL